MKKMLCWFLCLAAEAALAYSLPAEYIIGEMAKRCTALSEANFRGLIKKDGKEFFLDLAIRKDGLFIVKQWPVGGKADESAKEERVELNPLFSCRENAKEHFFKASIDLNTVSQGFFANEPVFIIGALPNDKKTPQVWIDKTTFMPVKEIGPQKEITFDKWKLLSSKKGRFPQLINSVVGSTSFSIAISENSAGSFGG